MKKLLFAIIVVTILFSLTACGSSATAAETPAIPLELTGLWVQDNHAETYLAAKITQDTIGVFFIMEGDDLPWTYWVGTFTAPSAATDTYQWESKNTYSGNGLLASNAEKKQFSYSKGKISFEVTMMGETATVFLERGEWDVSNIPVDLEKVASSQPTAEFKPLEILDSGYLLKNNEWLYYYVDLYNPNNDYAVEFPSIRITARDADNILLGTENQTLSIIYPNQHFIYGSQAFSVDAVPETVTFEAIEPDDYNIKNAATLEPYQPLEVVNTALRSDKIVGEIQNNNAQDYDMACIVALLKNSSGDLVGIESTFVNNVKANGTTPFDISLFLNGNMAIDNYDIFANLW